MEETLANPAKLQNVIIEELQQVSEKYGQPSTTGHRLRCGWRQSRSRRRMRRRTIPSPLFLSRWRAISRRSPPQSLRMSGEQKFKEGDSLAYAVETTNRAEMLVFTDKFQVLQVQAQRL